MALVLNGSGAVTGLASINTTVDSTEIGYLDGVSSAVQTQINTKAAAASQGLYLVTSQSFSGVSSVSVNNCFTATYDNYRVLVYISTTSATSGPFLRFRASGADNASSNYYYANLGLTATGTTDNATGSAQTYIDMGFTDSAGASIGASVDILAPALTSRTHILGACNKNSTTTFVPRTVGGLYGPTTSFDGFSIGVFAGSGTFTGTLRVYGYKNS